MGDNVHNFNRRKSDFNRKKNNQKKLEQTTRIRIDQERLEDFDSLDTSFLEGRLEKKYRNSKKARQKLFSSSNHPQLPFVFFKIVLLIISIFCIVSLFLFVIPLFVSKSEDKKVEKNETVVTASEEKIIDDNVLFVGDFHTEQLSLDDFSIPTVKVSDKEYEFSDILDQMRENIYQYNPSVVIIELGINDLSKEVASEEILSNIEKIVQGIQENRPYASIYIESIYPIYSDFSDYDEEFFDHDVSIEDIISLNKEIKSLTEELDVHYLDISKVLMEDDHLNEKFTDDGIHLNDDGYQKVLKKIHEVVGDLS